MVRSIAHAAICCLVSNSANHDHSPVLLQKAFSTEVLFSLFHCCEIRISTFQGQHPSYYSKQSPRRQVFSSSQQPHRRLWPFFNSYPRDLASFLLIYMASPLWDFPHVHFPSSSGEWVWEVPLEWMWKVQSAMNGSNSGSHLGKYVGCGSRPLFQLWLGRNTLFGPLWPLVWHLAQLVNKYLLN